MIRRISIRLLEYILAFIVITGALVYGFRYGLIKKAVEVMVSDATGFRAEIATLQYQWPALFTMQDVALYNPPGFEGELFAKSPSFYINIDAEALFKKKVFRIREWRLIITELYIEKNKNGVVNGKVIKNIKNLIKVRGSAPSPAVGGAVLPSPMEQPGFQMDRLMVEIKRVDYVDRSGLTVKRFKKMKLKPSVYYNTTDFSGLIDIIIDDILKESSFSKYFQLGQYYFSRSVNGAAKALQTLGTAGLQRHKNGNQ